MASPFDLAASHPTMAGASKKKLPSLNSIPDIVLSNTDMISFSSSSGLQLSHPGPPSPCGVNEVVTVTFSSSANVDAFQAFDAIDLEDPSRGGGAGAWVEKGGHIFVPPSSPSSATGSFGLDNFYRPPKLEGESRRLSGLSVDGSTAATSVASSLRRMSWQSIETFDQSHSGMESLVSTMQFREQHKQRLYKFLGSAAMLLALCYVVVSFFASEDIDGAPEDSIPIEEVRAVMPKFLDPFHGLADAGYHP